MGCLLIGQVVLHVEALNLLTRITVGIIVVGLTLTQVNGIAVCIYCIVVGPECGQSTHCIIPALGRNIDESLCVDEHRLRLVVPGTTQPDIGHVDTCTRTDDIILEHIAPLHVGGVARCYDVTTRRTVNLQCITIQIDVSGVIDKVHSTLNH